MAAATASFMARSAFSTRGGNSVPSLNFISPPPPFRSVRRSKCRKYSAARRRKKRSFLEPLQSYRRLGRNPPAAHRDGTDCRARDGTFAKRRTQERHDLPSGRVQGPGLPRGLDREARGKTNSPCIPPLAAGISEIHGRAPRASSR